MINWFSSYKFNSLFKINLFFLNIYLMMSKLHICLFVWFKSSIYKSIFNRFFFFFKIMIIHKIWKRNGKSYFIHAQFICISISFVLNHNREQKGWKLIKNFLLLFKIIRNVFALLNMWDIFTELTARSKSERKDSNTPGSLMTCSLYSHNG